MIDSVNATGLSPTNSLQNNTAEQEAVQQSTTQEQRNVQQTDSVTISSEVVESSEGTTQTSIQNAQEAEETASRIVSLFQEQPELAATAQGGRVTSEKVDAYLSQNFG